MNHRRPDEREQQRRKSGLLNPWIVAALAWVGVIFFSSTNLAEEWCERAYGYLSGVLFGPAPPGTPPGLLHLLADKGLHVTMFCVLAILLWCALASGARKIAIILSAGALIGSCSEFLQRFFPGRDPEVRDVLINVAGTGLGILLCVLSARNVARRKEWHGIEPEPLGTRRG